METELAKDGIQEFYFLNKLLRAVSNCFVTKEARLVIADNEHVKLDEIQERARIVPWSQLSFPKPKQQIKTNRKYYIRISPRKN